MAISDSIEQIARDLARIQGSLLYVIERIGFDIENSKDGYPLYTSLLALELITDRLRDVSESSADYNEVSNVEIH